MNLLLSEEKGEGIIRCAPRPIASKPLKQIGQSDGGGAKGTNAPGGGAELGSSSLNSICATIVIQFLSFFLAAEEPLSKVGGGKREKKG